MFCPSAIASANTINSQAWFHPAATKLSAIAALEETGLEWTIICNGFFLDYWGMPKVKTYLTPITILVDIAAGKAAIPGSGDTPVVFTYTQDVAKYTAAALTLDKWEKESYVIGAKTTLNNLLKVAEDVRGTYSTVILRCRHTLTIVLRGQIRCYP